MKAPATACSYTFCTLSTFLSALSHFSAQWRPSISQIEDNNVLSWFSIILFLLCDALVDICSASGSWCSCLVLFVSLIFLVSDQECAVFLWVKVTKTLWCWSFTVTSYRFPPRPPAVGRRRRCRGRWRPPPSGSSRARWTCGACRRSRSWCRLIGSRDTLALPPACVEGKQDLCFTRYNCLHASTTLLWTKQGFILLVGRNNIKSESQRLLLHNTHKWVDNTKEIKVFVSPNFTFDAETGQRATVK